MIVMMSEDWNDITKKRDLNERLFTLYLNGTLQFECSEAADTTTNATGRETCLNDISMAARSFGGLRAADVTTNAMEKNKIPSLYLNGSIFVLMHQSG